MGKYDASLIARYFLCRSDMSQKKLHKMLFFAYSWYLYYNNENINDLSNKLFEPKKKSEGFQAWVHGPVYRELYPVYAKYGYRPITTTEEQFNMDQIKKEDIPFFNEMFEIYNKYDADQLEYISHKNAAWINAREGYKSDEVCKVILSDIDIFKCLNEM